MANDYFPRIYTSFEEFTRNELYRLDHLYGGGQDLTSTWNQNDSDNEPLRADSEERPTVRPAADEGILFDQHS